MIDLILYRGTEIVIVRVSGNAVTFGNSDFGGAAMSDISGLKLDKEGTIKEFPDLKDNQNWRSEAIKRFKEKIREMKNEDEIADYVIKELRDKGYIPKVKQKAGFRPVKIK